MMISIIIPIYNVELYLKACIESVLCQTYTDLEVILVNDGSTDKSGEICDFYKKKDTRIKVIHKKNGGLSDARNAGLEIATGDYIAFLDSDDRVHPRMYEYLYTVMKEENADIVSTGLTMNRDEAFAAQELNTIKRYFYTPLEALVDIKYILISSCNKLYDKKIWQELRFPVGKIHEDEFVFHHTIGKAKKIVALDKKMYYYFKREGSITYSLSEKRITDALEALEDRIKYVKRYENKRLEDDMVHNTYRYILATYKYIMEHDGDMVKIGLLQNSADKLRKTYNTVKLSFEEELFLENLFCFNIYLNGEKIYNNLVKIGRKIKLIAKKLLSKQSE